MRANFGTGIKTAALVAGLLGAAPLQAAETEILVDRIVAIVNAKTILASELDQKIAQQATVIVSSFPAPANAPERERALQDAINMVLVLDQAKEAEIEVPDADVERQVDKFLTERNLNREDLQQHLRMHNQTYAEYKSDFRDRMTFHRFRGQVIAPLVKITDKDVETYYLNKAGSASDLVELSLRQIMVEADSSMPGDIREAKRKIATEAFEKISAGLDFAEAVKIYSDDPQGKSTGGLMEGIHFGDLSQVFQGPIKKLEIGQTTTPIESPRGYHIFQLVSRKFSGGDDFNRKKEDLEYALRAEELATYTDRWLEGRRRSSNVVIIKD